MKEVWFTGVACRSKGEGAEVGSGGGGVLAEENLKGLGTWRRPRRKGREEGRRDRRTSRVLGGQVEGGRGRGI